MKLRVIITGATGMVGEGVLLEALQHPNVEKVLTVSRKPTEVSHPKLIEIIIKDFFDLSTIEDKLAGYNACFFCLGVSSVGMKEDEYRNLTYDLTLNFAKTLSKMNSEITFCYVSGKSTNSSEQGRLMWARIKGKTENDLMKLSFEKVFAFRPGFIRATEGQKRTLKYYKYFAWLYPLLSLLYPSGTCTNKEIGIAMINVSTKGYEKSVLEVKDIAAAAQME